jgi:hypothetical protein
MPFGDHILLKIKGRSFMFSTRADIARMAMVVGLLRRRSCR